MSKTQIRISPADHGRRMNLADFDLADGDEGHLYELRFGIREYWIIDADRGEAGEMLVLRRVGGGWVEKIVHPPQLHRPRILPGPAFDVAAVFRAARD